MTPIKFNWFDKRKPRATAGDTSNFQKWKYKFTFDLDHRENT